jgi:thioredoxin-dependent peroxiredoxin
MSFVLLIVFVLILLAVLLSGNRSQGQWSASRIQRSPSWQTFLFSLTVFTLLVGLSQPVWALGGPTLPLNQPAPDFTLPSNQGESPIHLADYRGKWVVVYFYPQDLTPGCTLEAQRFQQDLPKFQALNTQILGISADSLESHDVFCDAEGLTFPLLSDRDGQVSQAYSSWLGGMSLRHTYVVDPEGILQASFMKVSPAAHSQELLALLPELQEQSGS